MSTVRRLYFYGLALISVEVVIWGVVSLLRTIVSRGLVGGSSLLATGLSLVLVGMPIFWLHWQIAQRDARRDVEERSSRIRAIFLYAVLIAILLPVVYALLALIDRGLVALLGGPDATPWFGRGQTAWDNIIAIVINAVAFAYFWTVLRGDWRANSPENFLAETRRLYRYLWVLIGLILVVSGVYNLLRFLFALTGQGLQQLVPTLAGGITLLLVGAPLWLYTWQGVQASLAIPEERRSLLRLVVLYLISLAGVIGVVASAGRLLTMLLRWLLGEPATLGSFLFANNAALGALIPLGVMWWYYGQTLDETVAAMPDLPRRAALQRLYDYILSLLGLAVTFFGLIRLVEFLAQLLFSGIQLVGTLRGVLSSGIAALLVGLPLWLITWREMQREAARLDDVGDHARRSVLRKAYMYLVLFLLVIGVMAFTGRLMYILLNAALSSAGQDLAQESVRLFLSLVIDAALLVYHWNALRQDGRLAQQTLGSQHAAFPTLIIQDVSDNGFAEALVQALAKAAPRLPVVVHPIERGAPDETMLGAKVILLPVETAMNPPEALRLWLAEYQGQRILVPLPLEGWHWLGQPVKTTPDRAREAAQVIRQMAEGEAVRQALPSNPWVIAGYVLGALFGLILLFILITSLMSTLFD